jgi:selenocysteine lyase/cysteine desulfurase
VSLAPDDDLAWEEIRRDWRLREDTVYLNHGSMAHVPLPAVDARSLQQALWDRYGIEVPVIDGNDRQYVRVSCHVYNTTEQIDRLVNALKESL